MNIIGYGQADSGVVAQFEKTIGFTLPDDYKRFLLQYNGGSDRIDMFYISAINESIPTDVFFGLDIDRQLDLRTWLAEFGKDLMPNAVIIGHDPGSGILVLINDPDVKGVFYWDHAFDFPESNEDSNTYKIANSFQEFIEGLKEIGAE